MRRWGDEEMRRWGDEEMMRWGDEEMGRWYTGFCTSGLTVGHATGTDI
ncbi:hypothetical protein [Moorena sp. SIO4G3]|nr:hypothetical protein [Moorena sp. SIO4G3]